MEEADLFLLRKRGNKLKLLAKVRYFIRDPFGRSQEAIVTHLQEKGCSSSSSVLAQGLHQEMNSDNWYWSDAW